MINVSVGTAQVMMVVLILGGLGLFLLGLKILRKPKWHPSSIYDKPPKPVSFIDSIKAPIILGWNMGIAYGEKKREERQRRG